MKRMIIILVIIVLLASCATEILTTCPNCLSLVHSAGSKIGDETTCPACFNKFYIIK